MGLLTRRMQGNKPFGIPKYRMPGSILLPGCAMQREICLSPDIVSLQEGSCEISDIETSEEDLFFL